MNNLEEMVSELLSKVERLHGSREEFEEICQKWLKCAYDDGIKYQKWVEIETDIPLI